MNRPFSADPPAAKRADLEALNARINALLPARYQGCFGRVQPVSMGSASLQYGSDGRVAWDEIWTSFCELALAAGRRIGARGWRPGRARRSPPSPISINKLLKSWAGAFTW